MDGGLLMGKNIAGEDLKIFLVKQSSVICMLLSILCQGCLETGQDQVRTGPYTAQSLVINFCH